MDYTDSAPSSASFNVGDRTLSELSAEIFTENPRLLLLGLIASILNAMLPKILRMSLVDGSSICHKLAGFAIFLVFAAFAFLYLSYLITDVVLLLKDWRFNVSDLDFVIMGGPSESSFIRHLLGTTEGTDELPEFRVITFPQYSRVTRITRRLLIAVIADNVIEQLLLPGILLFTYVWANLKGTRAERSDGQWCSSGSLKKVGVFLGCTLAYFLFVGGFLLLLVVPVMRKVGFERKVFDVIQRAIDHDCEGGVLNTFEDFYLQPRHANGWMPGGSQQAPPYMGEELHAHPILDFIDSSVLEMLQSISCVPDESQTGGIEISGLQQGVVFSAVSGFPVECHMSLHGRNQTFDFEDFVSFADWGLSTAEPLYTSTNSSQGLEATGIYALLIFLVAVCFCLTFLEVMAKITCAKCMVADTDDAKEIKRGAVIGSWVVIVIIGVCVIVAGAVLVSRFSLRGRGDFNCIQVGNVVMLAVEQLYREPLARLIVITVIVDLVGVVEVFSYLSSDLVDVFGFA